MSKELAIQEYASAPRQIKTLSQAGMNEEERRTFAKKIVALVVNNPNISDCTPMSVFNVILKGEALSISSELEDFYVVPYKQQGQGKVAQFQMGYKGYVALSMRTGLYKKVDCVPIYAQDYISYNGDTDEYEWKDLTELTLEEVKTRKKTEIIGWRAFAIPHIGERIEHVMFQEDIDAHHKEFSRAYKSKETYGNVFNGTTKLRMDRKLPLKVLCRDFLVKSMKIEQSVQIRDALKVDEAMIQGENGEKISYIDNPATPSKKRKVMTDEPKKTTSKIGAEKIDYTNVDLDLSETTFNQEYTPPHSSGNQETSTPQNETITNEETSTSYASGEDMATEKQVKLMHANKLHNHPSSLTKFEAMEIIGAFYDNKK